MPQSLLNESSKKYSCSKVEQQRRYLEMLFHPGSVLTSALVLTQALHTSVLASFWDIRRS
jgi:hypothetical protein